MPTTLDPIQTTFSCFCTAWKSNDGAALGKCFADDASLINPFGERADGREAVAAMYTAYFGSVLRGTSTTFDLTQLRLVEKDHALADGRQLITAPDGTVVLDVHLTTLLRRDGGDWSFVDARPYGYAPKPA